MESNSQMPSQSVPNQGQNSPPYQGYSPPTQEGHPQIPPQPFSQQGQYPPPPFQEYPPSAQGYSQPTQPYQQRFSLPNQDLNSGRPQRVRRRSRGLTMMLRGVILVVGGIVLSLISYSCASSVAENGGTGYYTIFTGAVVIGVIYTIVGLFRWIAGR